MLFRSAETGSTPLENARIKALAYYRAFDMPVFSCDSGLYFDNVPDELQPGVHVRNVNGKCLSDDEMVEYYSGLAKKYGNLTARYRNAICFVQDEEHIYESMAPSMASDPVSCLLGMSASQSSALMPLQIGRASCRERV